MLAIRDMTKEDKKEVLEMVGQFYQSDAVDHAVKMSVLEETFRCAASEDPILRGVILEQDRKTVGYAYLTSYFVSEAGGINLMVEELFVKEECRGQGYGRQFFEWLFREYPHVKRYRLEVTPSNKGAAALYQKMGFQFLGYLQMIKDK